MRARKTVAVALTASLVFGSTAATAAPPANQLADAQHANAWWCDRIGRSSRPASAAGQCASTACLWRRPYSAGPSDAIWLATLAMAVYILTREHHGHFFFPPRNSPA